MAEENLNNDLEEDTNSNSTSVEEEELQETASFLKLNELKLRCRARNLRLKEDDVIAAVDGEPFHGSILELTNMGFEEPLVLVALQKNDNDVNAAMMWLFSPAAMDSLDADGRVNA